MKFWINSYAISVNTPTWQDLQQRMSQHFDAGEGFALATLNMDHLVKLGRDSAFQSAYRKHDFVVADGNPIVWMSRLAGQPVDLMPGSNMVLPIARFCADNDIPVALIGGHEEGLAAAADVMQHEQPKLKISYQHAPPMGFDPTGEEAADILRAAKASGARLCYLALGAPKQELFAAYGRELTPELGFVSIGAGLDFLSGEQIRAPMWVRKMAMEWLWRLIGDPGRLMQRYGLSFAVLPGHLLRSALRSQD